MIDQPAFPTQNLTDAPNDWGLRTSLATLRERAVRTAWQLRHDVWLSARSEPSLFYALARQRGFSANQLVSPETQLVIEGFPRSANSWAVVAFTMAQKRPRPLAHHTHAPAQIIRAAQMDIPILVPIRHPRDAVASLLIRDPRYTIDLALRGYARFYEAVLPLRDRMILAGFDALTRDLGSVIRNVNQRFGTDFDVPQLDDAQTAECFRLIEMLDAQSGGDERTVARPSAWRRERKRELLSQIQNAPAYADVLDLYEYATAPKPSPAPRASRVIVFSTAG